MKDPLTWLQDIRVWLPVSCAIIGYATNWIAIRMLFRPHEPRGIGRLKYQGLIPKDKVKVAEAVGRQTEKSILTPTYVLRYIQRRDIQERIRLLVNRISDRLFTEKLPCLLSVLEQYAKERDTLERDIQEYLRIAASRFLQQPGSEEMFRSALRFLAERLANVKIAHVLNGPRTRSLRTFAAERLEEVIASEGFKQRVQSVTSERIEHYASSQRTVHDLIPAQFRRALNKELRKEIPYLIERLKGHLEQPDFRSRIKTYLNLAYERFIQELNVFQKLVSRIILDEGKVRQVIDGFVDEGTERIVAILSSPENINRIEGEIDAYLAEKVMHKKLKDVIGRVSASRREQAASTMSNRFATAVGRKENIERFMDLLSQELAPLGGFSIGDATSRLLARPDEEIRHDIVERAVAVLVSEDFRNYVLDKLELGIARALRLELGPLSKWIAERQTEVIKARFCEIILDLLKSRTAEVLERIEIGKIVTERVKEFPMEKLERSVLDVSGNKLTWIQILGGVLGFLAGIIQVLIFYR